MICEIAGLGVDVPEVGNMRERCKPYLADVETEIFINKDEIDPYRLEGVSPEDIYYLDTGFQFYRKLTDFDGLMLHASCVMVDGYAYLFSGPCGMGKSTHTQKYLKSFPGSVIINDDKPALRRIGGRWYAFGTPWCGKDGINENACAPIAGICFLHRGDEQLNRLNALEATGYILQQSSKRKTSEQARNMMRIINMLITEIPIFEFYNHAEAGAELITYTAMRSAIKEQKHETKS